MARLLLLAIIASATLPTTATACVWLPVPEQSKAEKRHWSHVQTQERQREAAKRLTSGRVDVADELAELLVPNIRLIRLERSDCGPEGEIDFAGGIADFGVNDINDSVSNDPSLKGIDLIDYGRVIREFDGDTVLGPSCNAEFRERFATSLMAKLSENELTTAWLFLAARQRQRDTYGSVYGRLIFFDHHTRRPPIRWWSGDEWIAKDIDRFKRTKTGRRLTDVMSSFWAQQEPMLASGWLACPKAEANWQIDRERLINAILQERHSRLARRKQLQPPPSN